MLALLLIAFIAFATGFETQFNGPFAIVAVVLLFLGAITDNGVASLPTTLIQLTRRGSAHCGEHRQATGATSTTAVSENSVSCDADHFLGRLPAAL